MPLFKKKNPFFLALGRSKKRKEKKALIDALSLLEGKKFYKMYILCDFFFFYKGGLHFFLQFLFSITPLWSKKRTNKKGRRDGF